MDICEEGPDQSAYVATRYRDGLIIALLIACPLLIKNLAGLVIGQHLVFDGAAYSLKLSAAETKTGRSYVAAVPSELSPYTNSLVANLSPTTGVRRWVRLEEAVERHWALDRARRHKVHSRYAIAPVRAA